MAPPISNISLVEYSQMAAGVCRNSSFVSACGRFVNSQLPILFTVILSQIIVEVWSWSGGGAGQLISTRVCCERGWHANTRCDIRHRTLVRLCARDQCGRPSESAAGARCGPVHTHTHTRSTCTRTPDSCTFPSACRLFSCSNISFRLLLMLLLLR